METSTTITIKAIVDAPVAKVWQYYTEPKHITKWNNASDDWHTTQAENDLRKGGKFLSRMEAKDGSFGFDFVGLYSEVKMHERIAYTMDDGRKAKIDFIPQFNQCKMAITFEAETENPIEMQKGGWQAILNNFKKYVETN
jgi:uncharacterized protein YndB with AHSA1/START domain